MSAEVCARVTLSFVKPASRKGTVRTKVALASACHRCEPKLDRHDSYMATTRNRSRTGPRPVERRAEWTARLPRPILADLEGEAEEHGYTRNDWLSILLAERYGHSYIPTRKPVDTDLSNQGEFFTKAS